MMGGKQDQLGVRLEDDQLALILKAAKKAQRTKSDWARIILLDRARAEIAGEADPIAPPNEEELATLQAIRQIEATDPSLATALLRLGHAATKQEHVARALKELAEALHATSPPSAAKPARKGPRR